MEEIINTELFIALVSCHPEPRSITSEKYKDRNKKNEAMEAFCEAMFNEFREMSEAEKKILCT